MTRRGWLLFAAMAVIWGIPYMFIKIAVAEMSPIALVFFRTVLASLLLLPLALRDGVRPLLRHWRALVAYTFVEVAAPWGLLFDAETRLSSSLAGLLIAGVPLVGAALAWVTGGDDRPDSRRAVGLLVGLLGVGVLVGFDVSADDLGAVAEIAGVVVGYAIGPMIISRKLRELPVTGVVAASLVLTALAYAPFALAQLPTRALSGLAITSVIVLGVICTAIAFLLFFRLVAEVGPNRATVITYFNPAVALVLGVVFLGEPLTVGIAIGFALIALGSFVATRRTPVQA